MVRLEQSLLLSALHAWLMRYCGQPAPVSLLQAEHSTTSGCLLQTAAVACSTHTHTLTRQQARSGTHTHTMPCSPFCLAPAPPPHHAPRFPPLLLLLLLLCPCCACLLNPPAASPSGGTAANNSRLLIKAQLAALQRQHAAYSRGYAEFLERHARVMLELILDDASGVEAWQQQRAAQVCGRARAGGGW